ncbi:hypothetical protein GQ43DRAFT_480191 [Delitschia confertaspora ATCC 74209]|uniref:Uncharacterized protein n=1 Tax=Delitschia confertaspora ATCC 74209 TaxID=1513339 RepID=A0A9P4JPM4_9PLEO|nr:hypothetical protein GQ43DRAFT_480191 [Delitschia confertaspora ATCC 74209]
MQDAHIEKLLLSGTARSGLSLTESQSAHPEIPLQNPIRTHRRNLPSANHHNAQRQLRHHLTHHACQLWNRPPPTSANSKDTSVNCWWRLFNWGPFEGVIKHFPGPSIDMLGQAHALGCRIRNTETGQLQFGRGSTG